MHMTSRSIALMRLLAGIIAAGLVTGSAMGGTTITPMQGSLGNPFNDGMMHGWGWNGVEGGSGNGVGTTHNGVLYDNKNYYGPGLPLHYFVALPYFYFTTTGYVAANIQVALSGFVLPTPAVISLLSIGGLMSLRRHRRDRREPPCTRPMESLP